MFDRRGREPGKGPEVPGYGGIGTPGKQTLVQQLEQSAPQFATSSAGDVATAAPAQSNAADTQKAYVRHQIPITKELTADEFKKSRCARSSAA